MGAFPLGTPVLNLVGEVRNPTNSKYSDGLSVSFLLDPNGGHLVSPLHAGRFLKSSRGNLYWGSSGVAGASLLAPGGTTAGFVLYNPAGSGVILEVERFMVAGASTETCVISGLALEGSVQVPSGTLTGAAITGMPLGAARGSAQAKVYKAATIVAMTFIGGLGMTVGATTSPATALSWDFDGAITVAPGMAINFCSAITQSSDIMICDVLWSEWPF